MTSQNLDNDFIHLTNNAVQVNSPEYGSQEDGNQLSFNDFRKLMKEKRAPADFDSDILTKMKYLCALTLTSVSHFVDHFSPTFLPYRSAKR